MRVHLCAGGGCGEARLLPGSKSATRDRSPQASSSAHKHTQSSDTVFSGGGEQDGLPVLARLQVRARMLLACTLAHAPTPAGAGAQAFPPPLKTHT